MSRPSDYTEETAAEICALLSEGMSLRAICRKDEMPSLQTVYRWLMAHELFREQYARAREEQADSLADECLEIAEAEEDVQRAKLKIDTRKWFASKMKPKKYGDRQQLEHSGPNGGAITVTRVELVAAGDDNSKG